MPAVNSTRWNSVFRQINSVLDKGHAKLNSVSREAGHQECVFTHKEWEQLTELAEILLQFKVYTDLLQGDQVCGSVLKRPLHVPRVVYSQQANCYYLLYSIV